MIKGRLVSLRPLAIQDLDIVLTWYQSSETLLYASSNPYEIVTKHDLENRLINNNSNRKYYGIEDVNGKLIGEISYWVVDLRSQSTVELGIVIQESDTNKGYGAEAVLLMLKIIFSNIKINKVEMVIGKHNHFSYESLYNSVINREGTLINDRYIDGKYYNTIIYGITKSKFEKEYNKLSTKLYNNLLVNDYESDK